MAKYYGSDGKKHKTKIIGLLPTIDYGEYLYFGGCDDSLDFDKLFSHKDEWCDENQPRSIYVDVDDKLNTENMTVLFDGNNSMTIELSRKEKMYLNKVIKAFIAEDTESTQNMQCEAIC